MVNSFRLVEHVTTNSRAVDQSRREYLDFVVDGTSLGDRFTPLLGGPGARADYVPVLVLNWPIGFPAEDYEHLIGDRPAPLPDGRVPLYICAECGDLGCGGVTAVLERSAKTVVWRDFAYQNDYEPFDPEEVQADVGPFAFDRQAYEDALARFKDRWSFEGA